MADKPRWQDGYVRFDVSVRVDPINELRVTEYLHRKEATVERVGELLKSMAEQAVARCFPLPEKPEKEAVGGRESKAVKSDTDATKEAPDG